MYVINLHQNTPYGNLGILEAISPLPLCLSGGDQMMPQGIIPNSLGDASRHHQGVAFDIDWRSTWYAAMKQTMPKTTKPEATNPDPSPNAI